MNTVTQLNILSAKKRDSIIQFIFNNIENSNERERYLSELESTPYSDDADELLENLSKPQFES